MIRMKAAWRLLAAPGVGHMCRQRLFCSPMTSTNAKSDVVLILGAGGGRPHVRD